MVIYGVTIKHLQNIHRPMLSVDNTFISTLYIQIKSLYSEHIVQTLRPVEKSIVCDIIQ